MHAVKMASCIMVSAVWIQQSLHGFDKVPSPITLFISYMTYTNSLYMRTTAPIFQMLVIIRIAHTFLYCDILTHVVTVSYHLHCSRVPPL